MKNLLSVITLKLGGGGKLDASTSLLRPNQTTRNNILNWEVRTDKPS